MLVIYISILTLYEDISPSCFPWFLDPRPRLSAAHTPVHLRGNLHRIPELHSAAYVLWNCLYIS